MTSTDYQVEFLIIMNTHACVSDFLLSELPILGVDLVLLFLPLSFPELAAQIEKHMQRPDIVPHGAHPGRPHGTHIS